MVAIKTPIDFLSDRLNKQSPLEDAPVSFRRSSVNCHISTIDRFIPRDGCESRLPVLANQLRYDLKPDSKNSGNKIDPPEDTPTLSDPKGIWKASSPSDKIAKAFGQVPSMAVQMGKKVARFAKDAVLKPIKKTDDKKTIRQERRISQAYRAPVEKHVGMKEQSPNITGGIVSMVKGYLQKQKGFEKPMYDHHDRCPHHPTYQSIRCYNSGIVTTKTVTPTYNVAAYINGGAAVLSGRGATEVSKISSPSLFNPTEIVVDTLKRDLEVRNLVLSGLYRKTPKNFSDFCQLHRVLTGNVGAGEIAALHYHCTTPDLLDDKHTTTVSEADTLPNIERIIVGGLNVYGLA